ncbi:MAG: hypothetical protein QG629_103 [Patescibacteria group bacterium]|nr:CsbD family protein [Candidatus Saccharibacteria bacterium]MDQ5963021.1 hypothetical protein [Patescibacteria group bacterium]
MSSTSDKISGKAKESMGKMTNNKRQEMQGKAIKTRGEAKARVEDTNERVNDHFTL